MNHNCPRCSPAVRVIYQPAKLRYWCPACKLNFTAHEVQVVGAYTGSKQPQPRRDYVYSDDKDWA